MNWFLAKDRWAVITLLLLILIALMFGAWQADQFGVTPSTPVVYRTISTSAYKLNVGYQNRPFVERFGTVALGVECAPRGTNANAPNTVKLLTGNDGKEYRVIDRAKVTPPSGTTTKPTILYGICAPEEQTAQCEPLPGPETQTAICPTGYNGSWQQTRVYSAVPPPECRDAGPWLPITPPDGACTPAPEGTANLPIVCQDAAAEGQAMKACTWGEQEFVPASPDALVRACTVAPCTYEASRWTKLKNVAAAQLVEVCGKVKTHPAPVSGGECGDASGTWSQMKYVPPTLVAGYSQSSTGDYAWLEWTRPRLREDGTELKDLFGYRLWYGTSSGLYTQLVEIHDPASTAYSFKTLPPDTYYFAIRAISTSGGESAISNEVTKTIK